MTHPGPRHHVLIAHAKGEDHLAEALAEPLRNAGYLVSHQGTVLVGESVVAEAAKVLGLGGPVVLCGTVRAIGTSWARRVVQAALHGGARRVFAVQMDEEVDLEALVLDGKAARYWENPAAGLQELLAALGKYFPLDQEPAAVERLEAAEARYRELALRACDIVDLANLPESDRNLATRQLELRRLFVPLRVRGTLVGTVETGKGQTVQVGNAPEDDPSTTPPLNPMQPQPLGRRLGATRRLVVLGDPGAGKSTLLRWIVTAYLLRLAKDPDWQDLPDVATLPDEPWLPVLLRCRDLDLANHSSDLTTLLGQTLRLSELAPGEVSALQELVPRRLQEGRALLLIDGLDEIPDAQARARFCQQIERMHQAYPHAPILVTSRIVGYRETGLRIGCGFMHVIVAELSEKDKDDFVKRWCALTEPLERRSVASEELLTAIHSSERIARLTGNPMLLTTLALVKRKVGKLPSRRAELYWEAVQVLLHWRSVVDAPLDAREALPQLEYLAFAMCQRDVHRLREDQVLDLFGQMRKDYPQVYPVHRRSPEEFLQLVERRTGLLVEVGRERHRGSPVPVFEFRHLTFQEYLAARALVERHFPGDNRSRSLAEHIAPLARNVEPERWSWDRDGTPSLVVRERWQEVLRLCVASCGDEQTDTVLQAITQPLSNEDAAKLARPRAALAARCLADEPNVREQTALEVLHRLIACSGAGDGQGIYPRTAIDRAAFELARSRWVELLSSALVDEYCRSDRFQRARFGGLCGMVRAESLYAFGFDTTHQAQRLFSDLCGDRETCVRGALALMDVVGRQMIGRDSRFDEATVLRVTRKLLTLLKHRDVPRTTAAAWSLLWIRSAYRSSAALQQLLLDQRQQMLDILADPTKDPEQQGFLIYLLREDRDPAILPALSRALQHNDPFLRRAAAQAIGWLGSPKALDVLRDRLASGSEPDEDVRQAMMQGFAEICDDLNDHKLLTWDINGLLPYWDPATAITEERVIEAAQALRLPKTEIHRRYEALARRFPLTLSWQMLQTIENLTVMQDHIKS